MVVTFTHKGTMCPLVLCQIQLSVFLLLLLQVSQTWETEYYLPIKSVYSAYHSDCPFSVRRRGVCLDWLLLVEVSKHTLACRLLLLVHHKEKWRKHLDREWTDQSISAVITLKAADISCCRTFWSAGAGTSQIFPHIVDLFFIKRERGFTQLKWIKRLKRYLFATQPNKTFFLFWRVIYIKNNNGHFMKYSEAFL